MTDSTLSYDSLPIKNIRPTWRIGGILFIATLPSAIAISIFISEFSFADEPSWIWSSSLVVLAAVLIWKTVVADAEVISDETHWDTSPTRWAALAVGIPIIGSAVYLHKRDSVVMSAREKRFHEMCDQFEDRLSNLLNRIQPFLDTESYLTGHDQETFTSRSATLQAELQTLRSSVKNTTGITTAHPPIRGFERNLAEIGQLLTNRDRYNNRFVEIELKRRQPFFDAVGQDETTLDRNQREAVVRNDSYNRVIAGAGTGKTLVLTTRVAYLVKYQDVDPADILVVTFLKEAAEEMQRRLREEFEITGIEASTLHSFGYSVIADSTGEKPDVFDGDDLEHLIDDVLEQRTELIPETFYEHFSNFLLQSELPTVSETEFETKEEFVEYLRHQDYETLQGETVKSRAEKLIADFLYVHRVEYKYEYRADLDQSHSQEDQTETDSESTDPDADETTEISAYRPDFYLPEAEIWIEHYGIDEDGTVAEWFTQSSEEYIEKIHWAREVFDDRDAVLLETYQFEFDTGRLRQALTHRLTHHNVSLNRQSQEELVNETYEIHNRNIPIQQMFTRFIELARTFEIEASDIPSRLSVDQPAQYYFGMCGGLLLDAYETQLRESGNIDFTDMIYEAASLLSTGADPATPSYDHVLVDEFQDIGQDQLQLITQLSGPDNAQLFAVGDDWQSIYSFQGAIVDLFINFEERFEYTVTTTLDTNYRSPSQIVEASVELIEKNQNQLVKQTTAASNAPAAVVKHLLGGYREYDYIKYTAELVAHLVADYIDSGCDPNEIMVLCRYDDAVSHLDAVRKRLHDRSIPYTSGNDQQDGVTVCSVHQAKGREADHVIVTHASEDGMGFPATDRNSKLLEPVREVDMNTLAEERRLFYVAITRSARTLDVITKSNQEDQSRFINEIDQYVDTATNVDRIVSLDPTKNQNTLQARVAHLWDDTHAKKHQGGVLEDHTDSVKFVSWASTDPPTVEANTWYRFENISVNEYKGHPQVVINGFSEITEIDPEDARVDVETIHYQLSQGDSSDDTAPELKATEEE